MFLFVNFPFNIKKRQFKFFRFEKHEIRSIVESLTLIDLQGQSPMHFFKTKEQNV